MIVNSSFIHVAINVFLLLFVFVSYARKCNKSFKVKL